MELKEVYSHNPLLFSEFKESLSQSARAPFTKSPPSETPLEEDLWSFDIFWPEVTKNFPSIEELYAAIQEKQWEIENLKEEFRPLAIHFPKFKIVPNEFGGINGSYFLVDSEGNRHFLIKPLDEEVGALHSEGWSTPFSRSPLRKNLPLYRSAMREVLTCRLAETLLLRQIVPPTVLGIFESDQFHDFSQGVSLKEMDRYTELCGVPEKEKLCSAQEYICHSKSLFEVLHDLQEAALSDDEIASRFDQTNFEEANILIWLINDTDAHMGNFRVYSKGIDDVGNELFALKKIDNGFTFPEKNGELRNHLVYLPNAKRALSETSKDKITKIEPDLFRKLFEKMGLKGAYPPFKERIFSLKELIKTPGITLKEINTAMSKLGKKP